MLASFRLQPQNTPPILKQRARARINTREYGSGEAKPGTLDASANNAMVHDTMNTLPAMFASTLLALSSAHAAEYLVAKHGSDAAEGLSEETAFATVAKGVSVLKAGDTLTILPGHYSESVTARLSGTPEAPITIRAKRPGTVLLRGDVDLGGFQRAEGTRYTYWVGFDKKAEGVADHAHLRLYAPVLSIAEVDCSLATFYQDPETKRLYVHTADSSPPDQNALSVSVTNGFGILLQRKSHDVIIDGLSFTGYNSRDYPDGPGSRNRWGLCVDWNAERIVIRRCTAYLNSGGIFLSGPSDAVVEDCYAFANFSRFQGLGNNILSWSGHNTVFRRNVVEGFWPVPVSCADITFYGGARLDKKPLSGLMENNLAINAGLMIKGGFAFGEKTFQRGNCAIGRGAYFYHEPGNDNLLLGNNETAATLRTYADPIAHDYRLQSDAPARGKGPNGTDRGPFPYRDEVFFVSPAGDDGKAGTSLAAAWQTLAHAARTARAGQTIYVTKGVYSESLVPANSGTADKPIQFLRRGRDRVVLDGGGQLQVGVAVTGRSYIHVRGFIVRSFSGDGIRAQDGEDVRVEHMIVTGCGGAGVTASGVKGFVCSRALLRDNKAGCVCLEDSHGAALSGTILDRNSGPGIRCDKASLRSLYSDANAFTPGEGPTGVVSEVVFATLQAWQEASGQDPNSRVADPGHQDAERGDFSLRPDSPFIGRGPEARPIGPYLRVPVKTPLHAEALTAHAVTATTATLECWTPKTKTALTVEWGDTPECKNRIEAPPAIFHSVGLTGLQPGVKYFFRTLPAASAVEYRWAPHAVKPTNEQPVAPPAAPLSFEALMQDEAARTFHVAVTGDDARSGLSAGEAWRTVAHAAGQVRAGDTVLIHEGTYEEFVLVRAPGAAHAPITFRAAPGETVWMEGSDRFRSTAFRLEDKHHVHIDGIRFRHFRNIAHAGGCISIRGGSNNVIRRCFHDGREREGYVTDFLRAGNTTALLVENCVMINGMGTGLTLGRCYGTVVRHCVFFSNFIRAADVIYWDLKWDPGTLVTFSHNLVCDNLPQKTGNPLFRLAHLDSLRSDHNGYFVRKGPNERYIVQAYNFRGKGIGPPGKGDWTRGQYMLLDDVQKLTGQEKGSIFGNPGIRAVKELVPSGGPRRDWMKTEMHWGGKAFGPLDFADFFCDPDSPFGRSAAGKPIGLDPAAFR